MRSKEGRPSPPVDPLLVAQAVAVAVAVAVALSLTLTLPLAVGVSAAPLVGIVGEATQLLQKGRLVRLGYG